jgi:hypothetical protein
MQQNYTHDADYVEWFASKFQVDSSLHSHCQGELMKSVGSRSPHGQSLSLINATQVER